MMLRFMKPSRPMRTQVLLVYPTDATFIENDLRLIGTFCDVTPFRYTDRSCFPRLIRSIARSDLVFMWFALGFAAVSGLVARLMKKPTVLVAGGWDVVGLPEIGYGRLLTARGSITAAAALSLADEVLAFSDWSARAIKSVAPRSRIRRSYPGIDTAKFQPAKKERLVLSVGNVSRENLLRKGFRDFVQVSRAFPEVPFYLVGRHLDEAVEELRRTAGQNMHITGWISEAELLDLLSRAQVYVQCSYNEGFGVALAEAMASGCVPVVVGTGAIPEVVGDTGIYAKFGELDDLAAAIRTALDSETGLAARARVVEKFNEQYRLADLRAAFNRVLSKAPRRKSEAAGGY